MSPPIFKINMNLNNFINVFLNNCSKNVLTLDALPREGSLAPDKESSIAWSNLSHLIWFILERKQENKKTLNKSDD